MIVVVNVEHVIFEINADFHNFQTGGNESPVGQFCSDILTDNFVDVNFTVDIMVCLVYSGAVTIVFVVVVVVVVVFVVCDYLWLLKRVSKFPSRVLLYHLWIRAIFSKLECSLF